MEQQTELQENLSKCRCCFRMLINSRGAVQINETIQNQFFHLTQVQLIQSEYFSNRICQLCVGDLQSFTDLRNDLVAKQTALYSLAGLEIKNSEDGENNGDQEGEVGEEEAVSMENYEMDYETVNENDYEQEILEEIVEESEFVEVGSSETVLKIEKITSHAIHEEDQQFEEEEEESEDYYGIEDCKMYDASMSPSNMDEVYCEVCGIGVIQKHYQEHVEVMHTKKSLTCDKCNKAFHSQIALKKHLSEQHLNGDKRSRRRKFHYCPLCVKEYEYKKQLLDHIRSFHQKERNSECHICKRRFYHRDIKKHIEHVHGEKKLSCEVCGKLYSCYDNLKLHMRYHAAPAHVCDIDGCGKKFHQKSLLEHHQLKHSDKKQVECSDCSSSFFTTRDLKRHVQRVHKKIYRQCAVCQMTFCRKDKYREHILKSHKSLAASERDAILDSIKKLNWYENLPATE